MLLVSAKVAFGIAEVIYGIKQVRFSAAVRPCDAGDTSGKRMACGRVISELNQCYLTNGPQSVAKLVLWQEEYHLYYLNSVIALCV